MKAFKRAPTNTSDRLIVGRPRRELLWVCPSTWGEQPTIKAIGNNIYVPINGIIVYLGDCDVICMLEVAMFEYFNHHTENLSSPNDISISRLHNSAIDHSQ